MAVDELLEGRSEGAVWLTLNRPGVRNALNGRLVSALKDRIGEADADPRTRVVVLRGAGPVFCSGGDLDDFLGLEGPLQIRDYLRRVYEMFSAIELCSKPVVVAAHGAALAGGMELCLAADLALAAEDCVFGTPEPLIGLTPGFAGVRLAQVTGLQVAKRLVMTGERISAQEAQRIGIVSRVCPVADLEAETRKLVEALAANAPLALAAGKAILNRHGRDGYEHAIEMVTMLQMTEDLHEGIAAFKERRRPQFKGR
jgi:enoyl-CoA hydratase/carnithine racemase